LKVWLRSSEVLLHTGALRHLSNIDGLKPPDHDHRAKDRIGMAV
jgi:hypothetical protein